MGDYTVLQPVHLGSGQQGRDRLAALERIAEREGFTWGGNPSIGRWLISLADEEIRMNSVISIEIIYDASEDAMYGIGGADGYDRRASEAKFEEMLAGELKANYPRSEISTETRRDSLARYTVNGGETDHPEIPAIENIIHRVWSEFGWLVK